MAAAASTAREASARNRARLPPAEVEPWGDEGGGLEAPATRPLWLRRTQHINARSVWAPVALKLVGLLVGMLALSGVGVASLLGSSSGVRVPLASMLGANVRAPWPAAESSVVSRAPGRAVGASAIAISAGGVALPASSLPVPAGSATSRADMAQPSGKSAGLSEDGKVILNLASVDDLRHLPGIGPKRADAILALRARLGRFKQVNDLLRVKGIGVRGLRKLMPHVILDAPKPAA